MDSYFKQRVSKEIFEKKYCLRGEKTVEEVFRGIAQEVASVEKDKYHWENRFYDQMISGKFIPAGRILANARPDSLMKNYNNCFVIPIEQDSMEGIFNALKQDALISKMGGGVGFNISKIRPKNSPISSGGESSGVISFLKIFDQSAKTIHTGGSRRSAHICVLNIDHPEIESFITCKRGDENNALTQFNISVGLVDGFISAVENDKDWDLIFDGVVHKTVKARYLYDLMIQNSFDYAEPGVFNLDIVNRNSTTSFLTKIVSPNPCGEQPLPPYGVCCLGAINFTKFVKNPFTTNSQFDWDSLKVSIALGVRFLDNVLDVTQYPLPEIEKRSKSERRIGLGFTGYGNLLSMLKLEYGSEKANNFTRKLAVTFRDSSYYTSILLAAEKGSFPSYNVYYMEQSFIQKLPQIYQDLMSTNGIRNIALNTIAPTGTTSLSIGNNCSSGIEPTFALAYERKVRTGKDDETVIEKVYDYAWLLYQSMEENFGKDVDPPDYFSTTASVSPIDAIEVQAIWQEYIDASISKTINLPPGTTIQDYKDLFLYGYKKGLKGLTFFNPDGKLMGIFNTGDKTSSETNTVEIHAKTRPEELICDIHEISVNKHKMIVLVGILDDCPYEMFLTDNPENVINMEHHKTGIIKKRARGKYDLIVRNGKEEVLIKDIAKVFENEYGALSRMISMSLRHHVPLQFVVDQLSKTKHFIAFEKSVARVLKLYIKENEKVLTSHKCPDCGSDLIYVEGCKTCSAGCGYSACS